MKPIKQYYPASNPLPKVEVVKPYVNPKTGKLVQGYLRRPKMRKGVIVGYKP